MKFVGEAEYLLENAPKTNNVKEEMSKKPPVSVPKVPAPEPSEDSSIEIIENIPEKLPQAKTLNKP